MRMELAIRFDYGSVVPWVRAARRRRCARSPGRTRSSLRTPVPEHGDGPDDRRRVHGRRRRAGAVRADLASRRTSRRPRPDRTPRGPSSETPTWWRRVGRSSARTRADCARRGPAVADHAEGAHLRADRRHRRRPDHVAAGVDRRRAQLGLPLLLAARRDAHAAAAASSPGYDDEAAAWREWLLRAVAGDPAKLQIMYGLAGERRLDGVRARLAARLRGVDAGAGRQRGQRAVPARRLRRGDRTRSHQAPRPAECGDRRVVAARGRRCSSSSRQAWHEPDEGIWEVRGPAPALHATRRSWPGSPSTGRCARPSSSGCRGRSSAGGRLRDAIHAEVCAEGFDPELGVVHPVVRLAAARRQRCC